MLRLFAVAPKTVATPLGDGETTTYQKIVVVAGAPTDKTGVQTTYTHSAEASTVQKVATPQKTASQLLFEMANNDFALADDSMTAANNDMQVGSVLHTAANQNMQTANVVQNKATQNFNKSRQMIALLLI